MIAQATSLPAVHSRARDRGQALPLLLVVVVFVVLASIASAGLARRIIHRDQAQAAADATALAYTVGGMAAAVRVAAANHAMVVSIDVGSRTPVIVTVVVRVADQLATARATDAP